MNPKIHLLILIPNFLENRNNHKTMVGVLLLTGYDFNVQSIIKRESNCLNFEVFILDFMVIAHNH